MYADFIRRKLPHKPQMGLYVAPKLPAVKLGKVLMSETRVKQPGNVQAFYSRQSLFYKTQLIFTDTTCFYEGGQFLLEDVKKAASEKSELSLTLNQMGNYKLLTLDVKNKEAAELLAQFLDALAYYDPEQENITEKDYSTYSNTSIDWLELRDEVMRTIDQLFERFNDGKLSLLEYEEKKQELLNRL